MIALVLCGVILFFAGVALALVARERQWAGKARWIVLYLALLLCIFVGYQLLLLAGYN